MMTTGKGGTQFKISVGVITDDPTEDAPILRVYPMIREGDGEWEIMSGAQLYCRGREGWGQFLRAFQETAEQIERLMKKYL